MKKIGVIVWLVLSLTPIVILPIIMFGFSASFAEDPSEEFDRIFNSVLALNILSLILLGSFIIYLYRSGNVPKSKRGLWTAVLLFGNYLAMPFFWYWYVWTPLKRHEDEANNKSYSPSKKIPFLMGCLLLSLLPFSVLLLKYNDAKLSNFIADTFPVSRDHQELNLITSQRISIAKKLEARHTRYYYKTMTVFTSDESVVFKPTSFFSFHKPFEIPISSIHSCSKQCGGSTDYILMIDSVDIEIDIDGASELLEWCWENKIPIISSNDRGSGFIKELSYLARTI